MESRVNELDAQAQELIARYKQLMANGIAKVEAAFADGIKTSGFSREKAERIVGNYQWIKQNHRIAMALQLIDSIFGDSLSQFNIAVSNFNTAQDGVSSALNNASIDLARAKLAEMENQLNLLGDVLVRWNRNLERSGTEVNEAITLALRNKIEKRRGSITIAQQALTDCRQRLDAAILAKQRADAEQARKAAEEKTNESNAGALKSLSQLNLEEVGKLDRNQCIEYVKQFQSEHFRFVLDIKDMLAFFRNQAVSPVLERRISKAFERWWSTSYANGAQFNKDRDEATLDWKLRLDWYDKYNPDNLNVGTLTLVQKQFLMCCLAGNESTMWGYLINSLSTNFNDVNWLKNNRRYFSSVDGLNEISRVVLAIINKL